MARFKNQDGRVRKFRWQCSKNLDGKDQNYRWQSLRNPDGKARANSDGNFLKIQTAR